MFKNINFYKFQTNSSEILPVELPHRGEHHGVGGHVHPHSERLGGEQDLDQPLAEQDLRRLLDDGQQPPVVDPDPPFQ